MVENHRTKTLIITAATTYPAFIGDGHGFERCSFSVGYARVAENPGGPAPCASQITIFAKTAGAPNFYRLPGMPRSRQNWPRISGTVGRAGKAILPLGKSHPPSVYNYRGWYFNVASQAPLSGSRHNAISYHKTSALEKPGRPQASVGWPGGN